MPSPRSHGSTRESTTRAKSRRTSVQHQVLQRLRTGLMTGALVPGQVMSLRKLAFSLGTSPMPVREALSQLVAANALEELPNGSVRVPRLSNERLAEVFRVREVIEGMAAKAACAHATPQLIEKLSRINQDLIDAIGRRDILACLATNQKFHFGLYQAAGSEILMPLIESLWLQCGPTMYFSLLSPAMPWDASAHTEILAGLRARKPARVQRALMRDIRTTARNLLGGAGNYRPNGPLLRPLIEMDTYFDYPLDERTSGRVDTRLREPKIELPTPSAPAPARFPVKIVNR
ncbi:MAG: GntR family transcriptional regulator [Pseudolabrys sp.]|nr:GntR family transcriptional regulator [Pseudolabrys sp.]